VWQVAQSRVSPKNVRFRSLTLMEPRLAAEMCAAV